MTNIFDELLKGIPSMRKADEAMGKARKPLVRAAKLIRAFDEYRMEGGKDLEVSRKLLETVREDYREAFSYVEEALEMIHQGDPLAESPKPAPEQGLGSLLKFPTPERPS